MSSSSPSRVLGSADGQAYSDNPYSPTSQDPAQVDSLEPATERTSLLSSSSPNVRKKAGPRTASARSDPASFTANGEGDEDDDLPPTARIVRRRPWSLKLDFGIACILLYANFSFLLLCIAAINSPFISHNALPPHRGSMFVPIWVTLLSTITNVLALLAFAYPEEGPLFSAYTSLVSAFLSTLILILCMSVTQLRRHEGILTLVVLLLAILSTLHAAFSAILTSRYAPLLLAKATIRARAESGERYSFWQSLKRAASGTWAFVHISLPLAILHIAVPLVFLLLTISAIIRTVDSSVEQQGQRWKVNPWVWSRQRFPEIGGGLWEQGGRDFQVHLSCRGVGIDEPVPPLALAFAPSTLSHEVEAMERKTVRRTILVESDQGVAGRVGADWVLRMLKDGELTSGDFETRVCFWDRPGYGFSDNSPASSTPSTVTALTQALTLAGEMARLEPAPSLSSLSLNSTFEDSNDSLSAMAPTPLARSGFILVATNYGALQSSLFATINPRLIHSFLYLSPLSPSLHFSRSHSFLHAVPAFFTRTIPALSTELGIWGIASVLKGRSRMSRVLSDERDAVRGEMERSWLEEEAERDKGKDSISWRAWKAKRGRYPERPTVILSEAGGAHARGKRYSAAEWDAGQQKFVDEVVQEGLIRWEKDWTGSCDDEGKGKARCRNALWELVRKD